MRRDGWFPRPHGARAWACRALDPTRQGEKPHSYRLGRRQRADPGRGAASIAVRSRARPGVRALSSKISKTTPCTVAGKGNLRSQTHAPPETFCHVGREDELLRRANHWQYFIIPPLSDAHDLPGNGPFGALAGRHPEPGTKVEALRRPRGQRTACLNDPRPMYACRVRMSAIEEIG